MPKQMPATNAPEKPKPPYQAQVHQLSPEGMPHSQSLDIAEPDVHMVLSMVNHGHMSEVASVHIRHRETEVRQHYLSVMWEAGITSVETFDEIKKAGTLPVFSAEMLARFLKLSAVRRSRMRVTHNPFDGLTDLPPLDQPETTTRENHEERCRLLAAQAMADFPHLAAWYSARGIIDPIPNTEPEERFDTLTIPDLDRRDKAALISGLSKPTTKIDIYTHRQSPSSEWLLPGLTGLDLSKDIPDELTLKLEPGTDQDGMKQLIKDWLADLNIRRHTQEARLKTPL